MRRLVTIPVGLAVEVWGLALDLVLGPEEVFEYRYSTTPEGE